MKKKTKVGCRYMHPAYQESKHLNENLCCFAVAISIECLNEVSLCNSNIY